MKPSEALYGVEDLPKEGLSKVAEGASALRKAQAELETHNELGKLLAERIRKIETEELPEAMRELGVEKFTLKSGETITVREEVSADINKDNKDKCFAWLRRTGNDSLIKRVVSVAFGRGDDALATKMLKAIEKLAPDLETQDKAVVNAQTLKAFVRERVELEKPDEETGEVHVKPADRLPRELFGVFIINRAVVKTGKPKSSGVI